MVLREFPDIKSLERGNWIHFLPCNRTPPIPEIVTVEHPRTCRLTRV
jgi:hypothetical protein